MNTSQYMDKQIMDLSKSQSKNNSSSDFIDLMNPQEDDDVAGDGKKEEIVPSYDFQPIRPTGSPPQHSTVDSGNGNGGGARAWSSAEAKLNSAGIGNRHYSSLDSVEPAKVVPEKDCSASNVDLVFEIDRMMKKHADNLMHALEGVSARLSQLESRSRHLENSVDDLKIAVGNNQGSTDGKLRQLENILREVQSGVQVIQDKQDILEGQLHLAKLQTSKVDHQPEPQSNVQSVSFQQMASAPLHSHHQQPPAPPHPMSQPPPSLPLPSPPNAPQQIPPPLHLPHQFPPTPQRDSYFSPPNQPQETPNQYQPPPSQPPQTSLAAPSPPVPQYQPPPPPQYSQPPPPQQHQVPLGHHLEEAPYPPPPQQTYPPHPHNAAANPPSQQFYGSSSSHLYEPPSGRPSAGYSPPYGPISGPNEPPPYPYGGLSAQYGGGGMKQQLPTARVLPQALPTASSGVGGGSSSPSSTGNRVPIDDVVDKVTNMGFSRDQVRATVRKLTENGQAVDLNIVLDKLMNDGVEGQPPRGWFGR